MLPSLLDSSSGMSFKRKRGLWRMPDQWQDVERVFLYRSKLTIAMADRRSALLT